MAKKNWKYENKIKKDWRHVTKEDVKPKGGEEIQVRISFEYAEAGDDFCLSRCQSDDVKHAIDCFRRLTTLTWIQVLQTATKAKGEKTGLHWTPYEDGDLNVERPKNVSQDHTIAGIRAGGKYRIFGFRFGNYFHVIWWDPEHKVCDG